MLFPFLHGLGRIAFFFPSPYFNRSVDFFSSSVPSEEIRSQPPGPSPYRVVLNCCFLRTSSGPLEVVFLKDSMTFNPSGTSPEFLLNCWLSETQNLQASGLTALT